MGYVPVQRDAGQIMYQGAMQRARTLGQTARDITDFLYQKDEENKAFGAKLKSLESLLQTHSDKFGIKEDELKQFLSMDPNESPKERYLRLGGFIEGSMKAAEMEKQAQALEAAKSEAILRKAQAGKLGVEERAGRLQNLAMEEDLRRSYGLSLTGDVATPQGARPAPVSAVEAPSAPQPTPRRSIYEMPGQPPMSPEERAYVEQQSATATPAPATGAEAAAKFAPPVGGQSAFQTPPGLDPQIYASAKAEGLRSIAAGRGPIDVMAQYNKILTAQKTERKQALVEKEQMTLDQAYARAKQLDSENPDRFHSVKPNPDGVSYSIEVSLRPPTSEKQAETARLTELSKKRAETATQRLGEIRDAGTAARDNLARYDRMETALLSGIRTGFATDALNQITSVGVAAGIYPKGQQAQREVLLKDLRVDALQNARLYYKGQGNVSQTERAYIDRVSTDAETNPEALLELIRINRALALRSDAADEQRASLEKQYRKDPEREITVSDAMDDWYRSNPLNKFRAAARTPVTLRQTADDMYNEVMGGKK